MTELLEDVDAAVVVERPHRATIDLDSARCYRAIHGHVVDDAPGLDEDLLLAEALPRFLDLCASLSITATLFVVSDDLRRERYARVIAAAAAAGHQVMSHSHRHAYDLSRWSYPAIVDDLQASRAAIASVTSTVPVGFRAPGYNLSPTLLRALGTTGFVWSSSVLPSPAYFAARALVLAKTRLQGRTSSSLLGSPQAFSPWWWSSSSSASLSIAEYPITAPAGLPWTGTTLALLGDRAAAALTKLALATTSAADLVFELHAADFADGKHLPAGQPDAHVPLAAKVRRLTSTLIAVRDHV